MRSVYNKHHEHAEFRVGEEVFLSTQREGDIAKIKFPAGDKISPKFLPKYLGPFRIIGNPSSHAYTLALPKGINIHPTVHIRYLVPPKVTTKYPDRIIDYRQRPTLIGDIPRYEVEAIYRKRLKKYGKGARLEYLVHYKGYPSEEDTWEPMSELAHCQDLIDQFNTVTDAITVHYVYIV